VIRARVACREDLTPESPPSTVRPGGLMPDGWNATGHAIEQMARRHIPIEAVSYILERYDTRRPAPPRRAAKPADPHRDVRRPEIMGLHRARDASAAREDR